MVEITETLLITAFDSQCKKYELKRQCRCWSWGNADVDTEVLCVKISPWTTVDQISTPNAKSLLLHYHKSPEKVMITCLQNCLVFIDLLLLTFCIYWKDYQSSVENIFFLSCFSLERMWNIFSSIYVLLNKFCLFGGNVNCCWNCFNMISWEWFGILTSDVAASIFTNRGTIQQNITT